MADPQGETRQLTQLANGLAASNNGTIREGGSATFLPTCQSLSRAYTKPAPKLSKATRVARGHFIPGAITAMEWAADQDTLVRNNHSVSARRRESNRSRRSAFDRNRTKWNDHHIRRRRDRRLRLRHCHARHDDTSGADDTLESHHPRRAA